MFLDAVFTLNQIGLLVFALGFYACLALIWKPDGSLRFLKKKAYKGDMRQVGVNADNPGMPDNTISSTKYTPLNFLFKALYGCFLQNVNRYFLIIALLQLNAKLTPVNPMSTWGPLFLVVFLRMLKEGYDDLNLRKGDRAANSREVTVCRGEQRQKVPSASLRVGDVLYLTKDSEVPADMVVLKTSDELGGCYIQTTNLDGESDLKPRRALTETSELSEARVAAFKGTINCAHPNAAVYSFDANLVMEGGEKKLSLSADQTLLQCTHLRNTDWVYGAVVYTGNESKFGCNKSPQPSKMPQVDIFKNRVAFPAIFGLIMALSIAWGIAGLTWMNDLGKGYAYLGYDLDDDADDPLFVIVFPIRFVLLISLMIPISLEVNLEFNRTLYAKWIDWDMEMYDAESQSFAHARCSTLAEDLGQIEYVLTDKTGTLTENQMVFKKCSINNVIYGHSLDAADVWSDKALKRQVDNGDETVVDYFRCLALCHAVMPAGGGAGQGPVDGGRAAHAVPEYSSASPDEEALCRAAAFFGVVFLARSTAELLVAVGEEAEPERWLLLNTLEFSSDRKRMSVLVREASTGRIRIYIKGADDRVAARVRKGQDIARCKMHLDTFAEAGLRTLLVGVRDVPEAEYAAWVATFEEANAAVIGREEKLEAVYTAIERDFKLLGATAIEDKLQEGVPDTIALLRRANLRFWMLTGDKYETAIQVGRACRLLSLESSGATLLTIRGDDAEQVGACIHEYLKDLRDERYVEHGKNNEVAIIIEGADLAIALEHHLDDFGELGVQAHCVICCRVTPAQKAAVVKLVKERKKMTLAIGDGGNDVAMIQEAHVGVGISGKEGLQAARASNYCLARFRYLSRLLLVHGRYSYKRTAAMMQYSFYRSLFIALMQLQFNMHAGYSGVSFFHSMYIAAWAVITVFPAVSLTFDKDVTEASSFAFPALYMEGQQGKALSLRTFVQWSVMGIAQSVLVFHLVFLSFGTDYMHPKDGAPIDFDSAGMTLYTAALMVQVGVVYVEHNSLHRWNHALMAFCLFCFFVSYAFFGVVYVTAFEFNTLYGSFPRMSRDPTYWIGTLAIAAGAVLPQLALKVLVYQLDPAPYQVVQYYERTRAKKGQGGKGGKAGKGKKPPKGDRAAAEPLGAADDVRSEAV